MRSILIILIIVLTTVNGLLTYVCLLSVLNNNTIQNGIGTNNIHPFLFPFILENRNTGRYR